MTRTAYAIIGAGYGDEGKGLMTDYLAATLGADIVVRTNGGAQAGHTVTTGDGRRHVFSHIGSGALAGTATHLSQFFVVHPMFFLGEREKVAGLGGNVAVSADPRAVVTTPFDIMINQIAEEARGTARHGSCGMGFGETLERNLHPDLSITVRDLTQTRVSLISKLERIRREWIRPRLQRLGVTAVPTQFEDLIADNDILLRFLEDCEAFVDFAEISPDASISGAVIFEGAQGLLLDQDYGSFPHVTRSNTGILNMAAVAEEAGIDRIEANYMTRAYVTRHGAGPLAHQGEDMDFADIVDPTNISNDWQGSIRTAPLDLDVLAAAVKHDLGRAGLVEVDARLAITCLDQLHDRVVLFAEDARIETAADELTALAGSVVGLRIGAEVRGTCRGSVSAMNGMGALSRSRFMVKPPSNGMEDLPAALKPFTGFARKNHLQIS